jgi:hypothetical protein
MATKHVDIAETNGISASQMNEFFRLAAIPGSHINRRTFQAFIEKRDPFGSRLLFKETDLLRPVETFDTSGEDDVLDEDAFFQSRKRKIWVAPSFREKFGRTFRKSRASNRKHVACELKRNANDTAIRADLPGRHPSTLGDIARLIKRDAFSKDCAYVAYVEDENKQVFAVNVYWVAEDREWFVSAWWLDVFGDWFAGCRVLCPGNAVL